MRRRWVVVNSVQQTGQVRVSGGMGVDSLAQGRGGGLVVAEPVGGPVDADDDGAVQEPPELVGLSLGMDRNAELVGDHVLTALVPAKSSQASLVGRAGRRALAHLPLAQAGQRVNQGAVGSSVRLVLRGLGSSMRTCTPPGPVTE